MSIQSFEDLPLSMEVLKSTRELGFENLFPIQAQAILPLLDGKDVIGQARTGTGKTAAFGIPMVERINPKIRKVQGLVLVPTRELAIQVAKHIKCFAKHTKLRILPVYSGEPIQRQIRELSRGIQIVVGTPGRTIDLIERGILDLASTKIVVLDEADRMLDMGFIEDIDHILSRTPSNRQTSLFSATIDRNVIKICNKYMKKPEKILVSKDEIALTQMKQFYMLVNPYNKFEILLDVLEKNRINRAIIFCKTRRGTSKLSDKLRRARYNARALHAGFTQSQRNRVITEFREGKLDLLTATDVASRGLDIQGITHIINYDVPREALVYFHRIGRTARMGQDGTAKTLVGYGEISGFNNIKALTKTTIEEITEIQTIQTPI